MPSTLVCPDCDAKVRTRQEVEPGKKIRCPKCESVFVVPEEDDAAEEKAAAIQTNPSRRSSRAAADDEDQKTVRRSRSRDEDEDEEEDRGPRKKPKKKKKKSGGVPVLVWVLLGVLVLGGGGVGLYFALSGKDESKQAKGGDNKGGGDKPADTEGKLTVENFNKVKGNMTEAEVTRLLGPASGPPREEQRGPFRSRTFTWADATAAAETRVNATFINDKLGAGGGQINGKKVFVATGPGGNDPFGGGSKVTRENFQQIENSMRGGGNRMNRSQVEALLGEPSSNLGNQVGPGGFAAETYVWNSPGGESITVGFSNGQVSSLRWKAGR